MDNNTYVERDMNKKIKIINMVRSNSKFPQTVSRLIKRILPLSIVFFIFSICALNVEADNGNKLPTVIITVDTETTYHDHGLISMPDQLDTVCSGNIQCGLNEIVSLLRAKGYGATFFLNVYEYKEYGEPSVEKIARWLCDSGQDVELHTHPQWAYDRKRNMMYQYTLQEQASIIRDGKKLLEKWTGLPVVAHRAGAYSADENTLKALIANGIFYDSSLFYGWPDSKIASLDLKKNALSHYGPLLEFPVTVYNREEYPVFLGSHVEPISKIRKYDVNWFIDSKEAEESLSKAMRSDMDFIILFLHSFSFIKVRDSKGDLIVDSDAINRFRYILDFISAQGLKVVTFRDVQADGKNYKLNYVPDRIPEVPVKIGIADYVRQALDINRNNYVKYIVLSALFLVLLGLLFVVILRNIKVNKSPIR